MIKGTEVQTLTKTHHDNHQTRSMHLIPVFPTPSTIEF